MIENCPKAADYHLPPLGTFVPHAEFRVEWLPFLQHRHSSWFLPTECVLYTLEPQCPDIARAYGTHLYVPSALGHPGPVCSYAELREYVGSEKFRGSYDHPEVVLCEVHANRGDDGHTQHQLEGWCFVQDTVLKAQGWGYHHDSGEGRRTLPLPAPDFMKGRHSDYMEIA